MSNRKKAQKAFSEYGDLDRLYYSRNSFSGEHGRWVGVFTDVILGLPIGFNDPNNTKEKPGVSYVTATSAMLDEAGLDLRHQYSGQA